MWDSHGAHRRRSKDRKLQPVDHGVVPGCFHCSVLTWVVAGVPDAGGSPLVATAARLATTQSAPAASDVLKSIFAPIPAVEGT